jgi:NAD(P)-dependent dehydrogenase (short-subunit alcohol dehydrogenase family)
VNAAGNPPLANRIALVTGTSRGIGAATALALARAGAHVVAVARTVGGLEELDDAIRAVGGTATLVPLDITDTEGVVRLAAALDARYQRLDILVGNAGLVGPSSPLDHVPTKDWDAVMAVNVTANFHLIRAMDALLRNRTPGGRCSSPPAPPTTCGPIVGPAPSPRPRSRRWHAPTRLRPPQLRCASISSIPGRPAPACGPP